MTAKPQELAQGQDSLDRLGSHVFSEETAGFETEPHLGMELFFKHNPVKVAQNPGFGAKIITPVISNLYFFWVV